MDLRLDDLDPLVLEELRRRRALLGVAREALLQEVHPLRAQLVRRRQLWRVALRDVVHDGPFVVEGRPRPPARCHLQDHAPERPDVDRPGLPWVVAPDELGGHVHRRARHGLVRLCLGLGFRKALALASNDLGRAEVDVLDNPIIVEEDVYRLVSKDFELGGESRTLWLDIAMHDATFV